MKSIKQLALIALALNLILASCTMQKRVYTSGYHIGWNKSNHNSNKHELTDNKNRIGQNLGETVVQSENEPNTIDNLPSVTEKNIIATIDNKQIILPQEEKINLLSSPKINSAEEEKQNYTSFKSGFKKGKEIVIGSGDQVKLNSMALTGFVLGLIGVVIPYLGIILGPLAIIFSAIGLIKIHKESTKWKGKGFAIAGIILGILAFLLFFAVLSILFSHK